MRHVPVLDHGGSHGSRQVDPPCNNGKVALGENIDEEKMISRHENYWKTLASIVKSSKDVKKFFFLHVAPSTGDGKESDPHGNQLYIGDLEIWLVRLEDRKSYSKFGVFENVGPST